jgi:hypothetical protein
MFNALAHNPLADHLPSDLSPNNSPLRPPENEKRQKLSRNSMRTEPGLQAPFRWASALLICAELVILDWQKHISNTP